VESGITLRVLGPVEVLGDGSWHRPATPQQRLLLGLLALRCGHVVSADDLVDGMWDGEPPRSARNSIQVLLAHLRKSFSGTRVAELRRGGSGYLLDIDPERVDVHRFRQLVKLARAAGDAQSAVTALEEALGLWRGPALADAAETARAGEIRSALADEHLSALEDQAEGLLRCGRHLEVAADLPGRLGASPLRERLAGMLMVALYRCGRQADALEVFRRTRMRLVDELGVEPAPDLQQLHRRILAGDAALMIQRAADQPEGTAPQIASAVPRQLPVAVPHFVGRAKELKTLTELLGQATGTAGAMVISAIGGMAGVGKTALAIHWAHQVAGQFPDGQLYVNLRGFGPSGEPLEPGAALRGLLEALGVAPQRIPAELDDQAGLYRSLLAGKKVLIVLDNARAEQQVRPLLPASPACLVLVTSRTKLAGLAATEGARPLDLDVLSEGEALQLLISRLGAQRAAAEREAVAELIGLCGRLPLALAVTAARAVTRPGFPLAALAAGLREERGRLATLDVGDSSASVRAVFSWSYQQLTDPAARMFRLVGLHPGPEFTAHAAASLAGVPFEQAHTLLEDLARSHLLSEYAPGTYALHDLLRAYATQQAAATDSQDDRHAALTRLFDYYLAAAAVDALVPAERHRRPTISGPAASLPSLDTPEAARTWLDERVLFAAIAEHTATHSGPTHTTRLATVLARYYSDIGRHCFEATAMHNHALLAAQQADDRAAQADALWSCASVDFRCGHHRRAVDQLWQALAIYRELGDLGGQARTVCHFGVLSYCRADYQAATGYLQHAAALHREHGDRLGQAITLDFLGLVRWRRGRYQQAADCHRQALDLFREIAFRRGEAWALANLAAVSHRLGRHADAVDFCDQARTLFCELGDPHGEAGVLQYQGAALGCQGRHDEAADRYQRALAMFRDLADLPNEARARNGLGAALTLLGRTRQAHAHHHDALTLARRISDPYLEACAYSGLAAIYQATGDTGKARRHWERALALYTELGVPQAGEVQEKLLRLRMAVP
jgi:DNA-binding SARP family transcriptional activator/tetratricopeptide (TPR) repeat protein